MRTGRSLAVIAFAAAALVVGSNKAGAQEQPPTPPDLRMLLNLDLFKPQPSDPGNGAPEQRSNASMLDQIRALKAMGYLQANPQANPQTNPETNSDDTASSPGASDVGGARTTTPSLPPHDFGGQR
jgi:hypothetical protein